MIRSATPFALLLVATLLAAAILSALAPSPALAGASDPVRAHLEQVAADEHLPGMAVAIVPKQGPVTTWTLGTDGKGRAITEETPFLLGSVSKSFTAAAVTKLVARGRLHLDDPLADLLPDHGIPDERADRITVEQLLTHTSGLTRADGLAHADLFDESPGALRRASRDLSDVVLEAAPGAGYEYSDLNYLLLGAVVEEVTGAPFATWVREQVAEPAGVETLVATPATASALPPGHRQVLGRAVAFDSPYDASGTPYGYLGTDIDGLGAWARAQLDGQGLGSGATTTMHTGRVETGSGDLYGYGWRVDREGGQQVVQHTGATPGYFTHVRLLPDRESAVVVMANSYSEARAPALAAIAADVERVDAGESAKGAADDALLGSAPFVVVALALLGAVVVLVSLGSRRRLVRAGTVLSAAVLVPVALLLPGVLGYDSAQLRLWAPDLGWGLWAVALTWTAAGLVALWGPHARGLRRRPGPLLRAS